MNERQTEFTDFFREENAEVLKDVKESGQDRPRQARFPEGAVPLPLLAAVPLESVAAVRPHPRSAIAGGLKKPRCHRSPPQHDHGCNLREVGYRWAVRLYRVILRSGAIVDVVAKAIADDVALSTEICLYHDDGRHQLAARFKRDEVVGLIIAPQKSSAIPHY